MKINKDDPLASDEEIAHVICVPGILKEQIDELIEALKSDQPANFNEENGKPNLYVASR